MSTINRNSLISNALFGKTQQALLALFFMHTDESFYLHQILRITHIGRGAAQRELKRWVAAGLLVRTRRGNQVHFQVNRESPVFAELKQFTIKTAGVADVLRDGLSALSGDIAIAFIHGSMAQGTEKAGSDVDVVIIGRISFGEATLALGDAQERIGREVNATVYSEQEFREKIRAGHHFLTTVLSAPKIFLIGNQDELERLGG